MINQKLIPIIKQLNEPWSRTAGGGSALGSGSPPAQLCSNNKDIEVFIIHP